MDDKPRVVECIIPILSVRELAISVDFYVKVLDFQRDWFHESRAIAIAGVSRDKCSIYLAQGTQGQPGTWVWVGVEDIAPLYEDFKTRGTTILQPPTNYSWGYEMRIEDPDGHVLRFASESLEGVPYND